MPKGSSSKSAQRRRSGKGSLSLLVTRRKTPSRGMVDLNAVGEDDWSGIQSEESGGGSSGETPDDEARLEDEAVAKRVAKRERANERRRRKKKGKGKGKVKDEMEFDVCGNLRHAHLL